MSKIEQLYLYVGLATSLFALGTYILKTSKQLNKLDNIEAIEKKLDVMNEKMTNDLVDRAVLTKRVEQLEREIKEIKEMLRKKDK